MWQMFAKLLNGLDGGASEGQGGGFGRFAEAIGKSKAQGGGGGMGQNSKAVIPEIDKSIIPADNLMSMATSAHQKAMPQAMPQMMPNQMQPSMEDFFKLLRGGSNGLN